MNIKWLSDRKKNEIEMDHTEDSSQIEVEQLLEAGRKIPAVILGNLGVGSITFALLWDTSPRTLLISMIALMLASIVLRGFLYRHYQKVTTETVRSWCSYFVTASFFSGLIWGGLGIMLEYYGHHIHGFQAFILGGMAAGGVVTNASIRWNYQVYIAAMLIPSAIYYVIQDSSEHLWMALMFILFMVLMIGTANNFRLTQFEKLASLFQAKKANDALWLAQTKLQALTQNMLEAQGIAHLGNWEWNIEDNSLFWSDEIYRIFGLTPQSFAATYEAFMNTVHPDDRENLQMAIQKTLDEDMPYLVQHRIILPDGRTRIVQEKGQVFKDSTGKNQRMVGTVQDITEQEIQRQELLLQSNILNAISDAIFVHPSNGNIMYVNETACLTRGFSKNEFYKMDAADLNAPTSLSEEEYEKHQQEIEKQIDEIGTAVFEAEHRRKYGLPIPVEVSAHLVQIDEKDYLISIARDITERRRIQHVLEESESKYRTLVENSLVGVYISDIGGNIHYVNDAVVQMMEYESQDEFTQQNAVFKYKNPNDHTKLIEILKEKGSVSNYQLSLITKKNNPITVLLSANFDGGRLSGTMIDVSEEIRTRATLQKMSTIIAQIDDIVTISDRDGIIEYVNDAFVKQTGYTREEVYGKKTNILESGEHDQLFYKNLWETILAGKVYKNRIANRKKNGELYYEQKTITPIKNEDKIVVGFVSTAKDITSNVLLEHELEKLATIDSLTEIYNRHSFEEILKKEIERSKRYQNPLSLVMLDIDHFKRINDTYGHDIGDKVLKQLARTVNVILRLSDVFARVGGEEFLILCPETNMEQAMLLADKIRQEIEATHFENVGKVTSSFGVTQYSSGEEEEKFLKRVDDALYTAKKNGRNRVEYNMR